MSAHTIIRRTLAVTALAVLALSAGCAVGPDYKRPQATTIPPAYAGATNGWKVAEPQAQFPKGNWWEMFGDAELNGLENQAAIANQELKVAVAQYFEARAQMDISRSQFFPTATVPASAAREHVSPNTPSPTTGHAYGQANTFNDFIVPLSLNYEVDYFD